VRGAGRIALAAAAGLGALGLAAVALAGLTGQRAFIVGSGSMQPAIATGSVVIGHRVPATDLQPGQVVTVATGHRGYVTHRVVAVERSDAGVRLILRGDANGTADPVPYSAGSVYRTWLVVPGLGYLLAWLAGPLGLLLVGAAGGLVAIRLARNLSAQRPAVWLTCLTIVTAGAVAGGLLTRGPWRSAAAWSDTATVSGTQLGTLTVNPSPAFNCGALGLLSVTFTWTAVPGATGYTLHYGANGATTRDIPGGSTTTATINTAVSGGQAWIVTYRNFGSVTWSSVASTSRTYTVAVVSLCT
jgi:signal peptidase I